LAEFEPLHTQIQKVTPTMVGTVILEDPHGFPPDETNLYCLDKNGEVVWRAQKPEPAGLYSRVMLNTDGNTLSAYAVTGQACELDLISGTLISQANIK
jgi:hypothetical protein